MKIPFTDVSSGDWFAENVKKAYELGLVSGTSETTFNPNADITIAETITLASRLNNTYKGNTHTFVPANVWYQPYVDYAIQNGIIKSGEYGDFNAKATRAQFAKIFALSLPGESLKEINIIEDRSIPDVSMKDSYATSVYKLYRAGILTGNDDKGVFAPNTNIQRSAVAAIVSRMAIESMRVNKTLKVEKMKIIDFDATAYYGSIRYMKINNNLYEFSSGYYGRASSYNCGCEFSTNEMYDDGYYTILFAEPVFITPYYNPFVTAGIRFSINKSVEANRETKMVSLGEEFSGITLTYKDKTFIEISANNYIDYNLNGSSTGRWNGVKFIVNRQSSYPNYSIGIAYNLNDLAEFFGINKSFYVNQTDDYSYITIN